MKWTDVIEIAMGLADAHPGVDPASVRLADLQRWVTELPGFDDTAEAPDVGALEAIQQSWIDEIA